MQQTRRRRIRLTDVLEVTFGLTGIGNKI